MNMGGMDAATLARITYMQNPNLDPTSFIGKLDSFVPPAQQAYGDAMKMPLPGESGLGLQPPTVQTGLGAPQPGGSLGAMGAPPQGSFNPAFLATGLKMLGQAQGQGIPAPPDPGGPAPGAPKAQVQAPQQVRHQAGPSLGQLLAQMRGR